MSSVVTRALPFLSSYFPLSLIFFVVLFPEHHNLALSILGVGAVGLTWMLVYLKKAESLSPFQLKISAFHRRDTEAMRPKNCKDEPTKNSELDPVCH